MKWFLNLFKKKVSEPVQKWEPSRPLIWWIDDLTHRTCALADHPTLGIAKVPWPDCDKFYLAIDKEAYDELEAQHTLLKSTYNELFEAYKEFETQLSITTKGYAVLKDQLKQANQVIDFYADEDNWTMVGDHSCSSMTADDHQNFENKYFQAGRRAREYKNTTAR